MNKTIYFIVPTQALPFLVGEPGIRQREYDHVRTSNDGLQSILKFDGPLPEAVADYLWNHKSVEFYSHDEILVEMDKPEWKVRALRMVVDPKIEPTFWQRNKWEIIGTALGAAALGSAIWHYLG